MKDNDGWETVSNSNDDGWETVSEAPKLQVDIAKLRNDALKFGYSGLSDEQKEELKKSYPHSLGAKAGRPFEDMIKQMDEQAGQYISGSEAAKRDSETGNAYTLARDVLSVPVGAITSTAEFAKDRLFKEGGGAIPGREKPWVDYFKEALELGNKGEGATGFLSEPTQVVAAGLPISKAAGVIGRGFQEGVKGAGLTGVYDYATGNTENIVRDMVIGGVLGGGIGAMTSKPASVQAKQEAEAIRTFPGDTYFRTQANKGAEVYEPLSVAEKKDILQSIQAPYDKEAWIRYYKGLSARAKAGYDAADAIAQTYKGMPGAEIPISELKAKMIENMEKGVGQYSKKDAERFVKNKLAGFEDRYGANGKVPVNELGMIKGKFSEDIFDPHFTVSEGTTTKRALARKAGSTIEDYRAKRPAYLDEKPMPSLDATSQSAEVSQLGKKLADMTDSERDVVRAEVLKFYENNSIPYNTLLEQVSPGTKDLYRRAQELEDIFQHQSHNVGSQRTGKGLLGKIFEGATHVYGPSGDAYIDPVKLFQKSKSQYPSVIGKFGTLGAYDIGRGLINGIGRTDSTKKK